MPLSWMPKRDTALKSLWDIEKDTYEDAWWKPTPPPKVKAPTSLQELMENQPQRGEPPWKAMWQEMPVNPYYWKTPQEKADIENRTTFAEWAGNVKTQTPEIAQQMGIDDPDAYADKMMAEFRKRSGTEVAMRAYEGEGTGIPLPTTISAASFTPQQGETAAERFIMEWVAPLGLGAYPFGARIAKPMGEAVVKGAQELAAAAKPTLREIATSEVGGVGKVPKKPVTPEVTKPIQEWFHGSKQEIDKFALSYEAPGRNVENLFGEGLYVTDNPVVAGTYAKTKGITYKLTLKSDLKLLDLEKPLPKDAYESFVDFVKYNDQFLGSIGERDVIKWVGEGKSGAEIYNRIADDIIDMPKSEAIEAFGSIVQSLQEKGYEGFSHIGGKYAGKGKTLHNVRILWNPEDAITSRTIPPISAIPKAEAGIAPKIEPLAPKVEQPSNLAPQLKSEGLTGEAGRLPPTEPPKPPKPGITPEEEASRLKFKDFVVQIRSEKPAVAQAIKAGTRTKMGTLEGVYAKPQGRQTFLKAGAALKGQMKPDVIPPQMTETDINNLFNMAAKAKLASGTGKINRGVTYDLQDALNKLFGLDPANPGKYVRPQPHQIDLMAQVYGDDVGKALMNARSWSDKAFDRIMSITNIPRVMQTIIDHSTVLRQNFITSASHPVKAARNVVESMKALKSPEVAEAAMQKRRVSRFYEDAVSNKVGIWEAPIEETKAFVPLSAMEESYQTRLTTTKNPVLRAILAPARLSERIYNLYGNLQRLDVAYGVMENMEKAGLYADWIASGKGTNFGQLINWASGRGSLPKFMSGKGAVVMNQLLYSPRLMAARIEYPVKAIQTIFSKSTPAPIRKEAIRQVVATVGAGASILALIKQSGVADVEIDPRSSDFGKIRIGNTRIDFWGGFIQYARFFAQLATNERKVVESGEITGLNRLQTAEYFVRGKLAPTVALIHDLMKGETYMGEEFKATPEFTKEQVEQRLVPLFIQDVLDAVRTEGWVGGFVALPGFFGMGVTSYPPEQQTNYFPLPSKRARKTLPLP